jgi:hypothetical protein
MELKISQHDGFDVVSQPFGGCAIIIRGNEIGPIFRNRTDAIDWALDTDCGANIEPGYQVKPLRGVIARRIKITLEAAYKGRVA